MATRFATQRRKNRFLMTIVSIALLGVIASPSAQASDESLAAALDERSFNGKMYWTTFHFSLMRFKDTIELSGGIFSSTRSVASGYKPALYATVKKDGHTNFASRAVRAENDYFV